MYTTIEQSLIKSMNTIEQPIPENPELPGLKIKTPDGEEGWYSLQDRKLVTIGRSEENDLVLPTPKNRKKIVSRQQCRLECNTDYWYVIDDEFNSGGKPSTDGTYLRRAEGGTEIDVRSEGRIRLHQGDTILIVGKISVPDNKLCFWEMTLLEDLTDTIEQLEHTRQLAFSLSEGVLFWKTGRNREEIYLAKQELDFIEYMIRQNHANEGRAVRCTYEELIDALWDDRFGHTPNAVNGVAMRVRNKIETNPSDPEYIITVVGKGYRFKGIKIVN